MHHALFIVLILCLTPSNAYQSFQVLKSISEASMGAAAVVTYVLPHLLRGPSSDNRAPVPAAPLTASWVCAWVCLERHSCSCFQSGGGFAIAVQRSDLRQDPR